MVGAGDSVGTRARGTTFGGQDGSSVRRGGVVRFDEGYAVIVGLKVGLGVTVGALVLVGDAEGR